MDEFAKMLKDPSQPFELHEQVRDSEGKEKYMKVDREAVANKTNLQKMAADVANEIMDQTFQQRMGWIEETRKRGNQLV